MQFDNDPVGFAIHDRVKTGSAENIVIHSNLGDDDIFPVDYFFRTFEMMPAIEQTALTLCCGRVLDVGAGGGCHSIILSRRGLDVHAIDTSAGAVDVLKAAGLNASQNTIFDFKHEPFDTIIVLMNGIGLAGSMDALPGFLAQLKTLLADGGKIYCDSTNIAYLYTEEDGSMLIDLNGKYYGEMEFNMSYKNVESGWFPWLYIDFENLAWHAAQVGLKCTLVENGPSNNYLASLEHL